MKNLFRYFNSSPAVILPTVMMYLHYTLFLPQVEDLLFKHGIDIWHETVRSWWNRFGPTFAAEARKRRGSKAFIFAVALASGRGVREDERRDTLFLARRGSRGRSARGICHETSGSQGCASVAEARDETLRLTKGDRDRPTSIITDSDEYHRECSRSGVRSLA